MDEENEEQNSVSDVQPKPKTIKPKRRPMPLVEGINTPKNTNDIVFVKPILTNKEKELISEAPDLRPMSEKLIPESVAARVNRKPSAFKKVFITLVILAILGYGGYKGYKWEINRSAAAQQNANNLSAYQQQQDNSQSDASTTATTASTTDSTISSTTPFGLAGGYLDSSSTASTTLNTGTSTPATGTSTPPAATPAPLPELEINSTPTGYLNVRSGPSTANGVVTQVHPGETYGYMAIQSGWYQISLPSGQSGWVDGQYVTPQ